jgi:hypothetical protein
VKVDQTFVNLEFVAIPSLGTFTARLYTSTKREQTEKRERYKLVNTHAMAE